MPIRHTLASPITIAIVLICFVIGGGYLGYRLISTDKGPASTGGEDAKPELKRMVNSPPKEDLIPPPPPPKYERNAPVLEQARKALRDGIGPDEAYDMAQSLPDSPERFDAVFLLLEYAAEAGHTLAALKVAGYYDPTETNPSGTIRKNPATAFEWYQTALEGGQTEARSDLEQLHRWVSEKADQGSLEARQLLKIWR